MKWISVKDKLPEPGLEVITYDPTELDKEDRIDIDTVDENGIWDYSGEAVTHWMYKPLDPESMVEARKKLLSMGEKLLNGNKTNGVTYKAE